MGPGSVLASYRLERELGRGGMGVVWLADDSRLGRRVALKLLPHDLAADPTFRKRFLGESRLAASLDHPHIVPVYDAGEVDGELYIAMRFVEGTTLERLIRDHGPIEPARVLNLLRGVADALDVAHARGLVHRDVKPGNILIGRTASGEHAYLSDFGLTKRLGEGDSLTGTQQIVGSVGYLAPEQIQGKPIDGRVDVYSLGCVLYTALTSRAPYERESDMATLLAHVEADRPRVSTERPELAGLDHVVERALARDPDDRFATTGALMAAFRDAMRAGTTRGFLFSDLRGYTAFVEAHGDKAGAGLLARYRELVRSVIAAYDGAEIRTEGDSFYVVFPSASGAVNAALAIVDGARLAADRDDDQPITVGVGVHAGETADTSEGPVGSAVNVAARLCAAAKPGEVLVSDTVRSLVRTSLAGTFEPRGRKTLKGVAEPVATFSVTRSSGASRPATAGRARLREDRRRIGAVAAVAVMAALGLVGLAAWTGGVGVGGAPASSTPGAADIPSMSELPSTAGSVSPAPTGEDHTLIVVPETPSDGPADPSPLAEGRYRFTNFRPTLEFDVPDGWAATRDYTDGAELSTGMGSIDLALAQVFYEKPCTNSGTILLGNDPNDLIRWVQSNPALDAGDPVPVVIAGRTGVRIDATVREVPPGTCPEEFTSPRVILFPIAADTFFAFPGERATFIALQIPDSPSLLIYSGSDAAQAEAHEAAVTPWLESLEFVQ
jgi:serine/threonine-protein kinase